MPAITLSSGKSFRAAEGATILSAAALAQVCLPYSCRTGRCSVCKCRVLHGTTAALEPESSLTDAEKANGWILSCVRTATSDVQLETDSIEGFTVPPARTLPCRIQHLEKLAPDVMKVLLRLPPGTDFQFIPGQYIDVIGTGGLRRSYSLANANFSDKLLELHVRAVDRGAMSEYWFQQARVQDLLRLNGPLGTSFLRRTQDVDLIFLATGTGIAPIRAILGSIPLLPPAQRPKSVAVLWGGRTKGDLYLDLGTMSEHCAFTPVLSRAGDDWTGARGHIQDVLLASRPDLRDAEVYACGSDAMVQSARAALVRSGLPENRFHADPFVCSARQSAH